MKKFTNLNLKQQSPENFSNLRKRRETAKEKMPNNGGDIFSSQNFTAFQKDQERCTIPAMIEEINPLYHQHQKNHKKCHKITYQNGSIYTGQITEIQISNLKMKIKEGIGRLTLQDSSYYEGEWLSDVPHGDGVLFLAGSGEKYTGQFFKGEFDGNGIYLYSNGFVYDGEWKGNLKHGKGVEKSDSGIVYKGQFREDFKEGFGILEWPDGSNFKGYFKNNNLEGRGTMIWSDGRLYEGEWWESMRHGKGFMREIDGSVYEGDYFKDEREGRGVFKGRDGRVYDGEWRGGEEHGWGRLVLTDGRVLEGRYQNGRFIGK